MKQRTVHRTTIPAAPGWYRCTPIHHECGWITGFFESPVIAWLIRVEELHDDEDMVCTHAIVADEVLATGDPEYLKGPDGVYFEPEGDRYETRGELIAAMQRRARTRRIV